MLSSFYLSKSQQNQDIFCERPENKFLTIYSIQDHNTLESQKAIVTNRPRKTTQKDYTVYYKNICHSFQLEGTPSKVNSEELLTIKAKLCCDAVSCFELTEDC